MELKNQKAGLTKEISGSLSYLLGPISGIIFLVIEQDKFVRFHAIQSILLFGVWFILVALLTFTIILVQLTSLVSLVSFICWLIALFKAWKGEKWEIPIVGRYAKKLAESR